MVCCCEHGDEYSDSIQFSEFLDWLSKGTLSGCCLSPKTPKTEVLKNTDFVDSMLSKVFT